MTLENLIRDNLVKAIDSMFLAVGELQRRQLRQVVERFEAEKPGQHHQGPAIARLEGSIHPVRRRPRDPRLEHARQAREQPDDVEHAQPHVARAHLLRTHRHGS